MEALHENPAANGKQLDLDVLMLRIQKVHVLTRPLINCIFYLRSLRRWENATHSFLVLAFLNVSCAIFPTAYSLVVSLGFVSFCGMMGYLHRRSQCLMKVFPNPNIRHEDNGELTNSDLIKLYKNMLFNLDYIMERYVRYTNRFYSVLKWDNLELSIKWYLEAALLFTFLHLLPLRWSLALVVNVFLLEHKISMILTESRLIKKVETKQESVDKSDCISVDSTTSDIDEGISFNPNFTESDESDQEIQPEVPGEITNKDDTVNELEASQSKPAAAGAAGGRSGVVGRLLEFKKKHQSNVGNCVGCNVQFSTILKRRHICSHCGNHFCSRCCSNKVPRSMFGATSPAAQTETVQVCGFCYMYLTGKKDPTMLERSAEREKETREQEKIIKEKEKERDKSKDQEKEIEKSKEMSKEKGKPNDQEREKEKETVKLKEKEKVS